MAFSPITISVKNSPIDSGIPALPNVTLMPEAAPRSLAGTEFMIEEVFGATNRPMARPLSPITSAKGR